MDEIRKIIQRIYKPRDDEWCSLFVDILINGCQLDGFVLRKDKLIILEMKNYHGKIYADLREGEKWKVHPPDGEPWEPEHNPFFQVRKQRVIITKKLAKIQEIKEDKEWELFRFVSAWIIVPDNTEIEIENDDKRNEKWFKILRENDIEKKILFQASWRELQLKSKQVMYDLAKELKAEEKEPDYWLYDSEAKSLFRKSFDFGTYRFRPLDQMLETRSPKEIIKAKEIILTLGLDQYAEDLIELRYHPDPNVCYHVLDALQYLPYKGDLTPILLEFMKDRGQQTFWVPTATDHNQPMWLQTQTGYRRTISGLAGDILISTGFSSATPELVKIIENKESTEHEVMNAVRVLKEIGDERAVEPIIKLTRNYHERFPDSKRFRPMEDLISALGDIGSPKALPLVISYAEDPDEEIRARVIEALGDIGGESAKEALFKMLKREKEMKPIVIESLGKMGDKNIAPRLYNYLNTNNDWMFSTIIIALGKINSKRSFTPIWNAFKRAATSKKGLWAGTEKAIDVLAEMDKKKLENNLLSLLNSDDEKLRKTVAWFLHKVVSECSIDHLIPFLGDPNIEFGHNINTAILTAIRKSGNENEYLPKFISLLKSSSEFTREQAVGIVSGLGDESVFDEILPLKNDSSKSVRKTVAWALGRFETEESISQLIEILRSEESEIQQMALRSLYFMAMSNVRKMSARNQGISAPEILT
ncbi:MAG: HEAT repeat domain-containing protein, partial [Thermoplasmata archaeon]|nr:HEAT repeat domain-containing protein [Thermoplasmata archaeon]